MRNGLTYICLLLTMFVPSLPASNEYQALLDSAAQNVQEKNYEAAAEYYANGFEAYKSHYTNQMQTIDRQLAIMYNVDKKEQELEHLSQALALKKRQTVLSAILIVVLLAGLILFLFLQKYRLRMLRQRRQQKENETSLLKLKKEKAEIEALLNTLQTEKIQKELMADTMLVEYKNKVFGELQLLFADYSVLEKYRADLERIMHVEVQPEAEGGDMQQAYPTFYERLQKQAGNRLTPLDLKYCRMIYLKMSSKEMANILQVEPKTIRVNKYRLKLKLGLTKDDDLEEFIEEN